MLNAIDVPIQKNSILFAGLIILSTVFSSCATTPRALPVYPPPQSSPLKQDRLGITHTVGPGETFWRIAKMYDVSMASIIKVNKINDPSSLKMGQHLFIPSAAPIKPVITLPRSRKWKYIIIHHSATNEGSSLSFHKFHLKRGWDKGVGYHFVVDTKSQGKLDGQIEVTPRWLKQQDGAHTKAADMNTKAIGIALVGNFNIHEVSPKQHESLTHLVNTLRRHYKIPMENILGHKHINGAVTDCPGKKFPWLRFKRNL